MAAAGLAARLVEPAAARLAVHLVEAEFPGGTSAPIAARLAAVGLVEVDSAVDSAAEDIEAASMKGGLGGAVSAGLRAALARTALGLIVSSANSDLERVVSALVNSGRCAGRDRSVRPAG